MQKNKRVINVWVDHFQYCSLFLQSSSLVTSSGLKFSFTVSTWVRSTEWLVRGQMSFTYLFLQLISVLLSHLEVGYNVVFVSTTNRCNIFVCVMLWWLQRKYECETVAGSANLMCFSHSFYFFMRLLMFDQEHKRRPKPSVTKTTKMTKDREEFRTESSCNQ